MARLVRLLAELDEHTYRVQLAEAARAAEELGAAQAAESELRAVAEASVSRDAYAEAVERARGIAADAEARDIEARALREQLATESTVRLQLEARAELAGQDAAELAGRVSKLKKKVHRERSRGRRRRQEDALAEQQLEYAARRLVLTS